MRAKLKRLKMAQKEGKRRRNAILNAVALPHMSDMAYKVSGELSGETFEMLTGNAAAAVIAADAIHTELGIETHLSLGSQVVLKGIDHTTVRRRRT